MIKEIGAVMNEYLMYFCPECKKLFKVNGNGKKVKCNQCQGMLVDMNISVEEWSALDKVSKEKYKNSASRPTVPKQEPIIEKKTEGALNENTKQKIESTTVEQKQQDTKEVRDSFLNVVNNKQSNTCRIVTEEKSLVECPNCKKSVTTDARFCPSCGSRIDYKKNSDTQIEKENVTISKKLLEMIGVIALNFVLLCISGVLLAKIGRVSMTIWLAISCVFRIMSVENILKYNFSHKDLIKKICDLLAALIEMVIMYIISRALGHPVLGIVAVLIYSLDLSFLKDKYNESVEKIVNLFTEGFFGVLCILLIMSYSHIHTVKNGTLQLYPDITIGKAFERYYDSPKWNYFKDSEGNDVIEFTGGFYYKGTQAKALIQFIEDDGKFEISYFSVNDIPQNEIMFFYLADVFLESYDDDFDSNNDNYGNSSNNNSNDYNVNSDSDNQKNSINNDSIGYDVNNNNDNYSSSLNNNSNDYDASNDNDNYDSSLNNNSNDYDINNDNDNYGNSLNDNSNSFDPKWYMNEYTFMNTESVDRLEFAWLDDGTVQAMLNGLCSFEFMEYDYYENFDGGYVYPIEGEEYNVKLIYYPDSAIGRYVAIENDYGRDIYVYENEGN